LSNGSANAKWRSEVTETAEAGAYSEYVKWNQMTRHELIEAIMSLTRSIDAESQRLAGALESQHGLPLHHMVHMALVALGEDERRASLLEQIQMVALTAINTDMAGRPLDWRETARTILSNSELPHRSKLRAQIKAIRDQNRN
jgi:hypothetical protein